MFKAHIVRKRISRCVSPSTKMKIHVQTAIQLCLFHLKKLNSCYTIYRFRCFALQQKEMPVDEFLLQPSFLLYFPKNWGLKVVSKVFTVLVTILTNYTFWWYYIHVSGMIKIYSHNMCSSLVSVCYWKFSLVRWLFFSYSISVMVWCLCLELLSAMAECCYKFIESPL